MKTQWQFLRRGLRGSEAYTITEVMLAVGILAFMGISLFSGLSLGLVVVKTTREDLRATQILTQKIEAVRLCTWNQLSNCPTTFTETYYPANATNATAGVTYYGGMTMSIPGDLPSAYRDDVRRVTVSLTWTNYKGSVAIPHSRSMQTQAARDGMQNYIWGKR